MKKKIQNGYFPAVLLILQSSRCQLITDTHTKKNCYVIKANPFHFWL